MTYKRVAKEERPDLSKNPRPRNRYEIWSGFIIEWESKDFEEMTPTDILGKHQTL